MSDYEKRAHACKHVNLHKGRIDGTHTVCLDCGAHVSILVSCYASGVSPEKQAAEMLKKCDEQVESGRRHLTGHEAIAHARTYNLPVNVGQGGPRSWQDAVGIFAIAGNVYLAWLDLPADKPLLKMSQQCRTHAYHDGCPGETALGTSRCECPCHPKETRP
jgi:hypothetical protein